MQRIAVPAGVQGNELLRRGKRKPDLVTKTGAGRYRRAMSENATKFPCPNCEAEYKAVRVEAPPTHDNLLLCLSRGGPAPKP